MEMTNLADRIRDVMASQRGGGAPACIVCGKRVQEHARLRLRGGTVVHRTCATYDRRRR